MAQFGFSRCSRRFDRFDALFVMEKLEYYRAATQFSLAEANRVMQSCELEVARLYAAAFEENCIRAAPELRERMSADEWSDFCCLWQQNLEKEFDDEVCVVDSEDSVLRQRIGGVQHEDIHRLPATTPKCLYRLS